MELVSRDVRLGCFSDQNEEVNPTEWNYRIACYLIAELTRRNNARETCRTAIISAISRSHLYAAHRHWSLVVDESRVD
jgi:hypothetical protein